MLILTGILDYLVIGIAVLVILAVDVRKNIKGVDTKEAFLHVCKRLPELSFKEPLWFIIDITIWPLLLLQYDKVKEFSIEWKDTFGD